MKFVKSEQFLIKALALGVLFIYILYNLPFLRHFSLGTDTFNTIFQLHDGLYVPLLRSLIFALIQAFLLTFIGLIFALLLYKVKLADKESKFLSFLLIPMILGSVSVAFIYKLFLLDTQFAFLNAQTKFFTLTLIQFWQFGSLFIYLFWLNQQTIPQTVLDYATAVKLNTYEKIKDIILPKQLNLSLLLFIIGFVFSLYEDAKIQFLFKASRGTNTELVNQWLSRTYHSNSLLNVDFAFEHLSQAAFYVFIVALIVLGLSLMIKKILFACWINSKPTFTSPFFNTLRVGRITIIILTLWILTPIVLALYTQLANFQFNLQELIPTLSLTFLAAILVSLVAVIFSILSRLAWKQILDNFNTKSMVFLIGLFIMVLVPPIVLLILGFKWMRVIGYSSSNTIYIAWIMGHILLTFPILSAFSVATNFKVENRFIDYLESHNVSIFEKVRDLFLIPFRADYLLLLIIAFALIWNEATINNVLSDIIPSFVTELNKTITGKSADYANGMNYLFVSLFLALGSVSIWNAILNKYQNKIRKVA